MKLGSRQTSAAKARISDARRARVARDRERYPQQLAVWRRTGAVGELMRPFLSARADQRLAIVEALGGEREITPQEIAVLDGWWQSQVTADVLFGLLARSDIGKSRLVEKFISATNSARAALALLGLKRRAVEALELELSEASLEAAAAASGRSVDELRGSAPASPTDRPAGSDSERRSTP